MRKLVLLMIAMMISFIGIAQNRSMGTSGQENGIHMIGNNDGGGESAPVFSTGNNTYPDAMNLWVLPSTGGTSGNTRAPGNTWRYQRTEYLIRASEIAASGFPSGMTVDGIGWLIGTAGATTQTGTLNIWLMNTTDATYLLGTNWTVAGFTQVASISNWTVPIAVGSYTVPFSGGSTFTYTGGGVYVAWEFSNPAGVLGTTAVVHLCNLNLTNGLYGNRNQTAMPTALVGSNWRPATTFINNTFTDVLQVTNVYVQEKTPVPYGVPTTPSARVANTSAGAETFTVTMEIKDQATSTTRYTDTQTVTALAGGTGQVVNFVPWTPTNLEDVNVTVTASPGTGEDWLANNTMTIPMNINNNLYGYCFNLNANTGYGFTYTGAGGIFATKFHMTGQGSIPSANLFIYNYAANTGNNIYAVVLNSAGTIVAQTAPYTILSTDLGTNKNFSFPTVPVFTDEDFYVGLAQPTGGTVQWYPMGCMVDAPYRANTFYEFGITGGTPILFGADYKLMIEAVVAPPSLLAHDVGTLSIDMSQVMTLGTMIPQATVKNFGANTETFPVTMTIGPYISTKTVTGLASGLSTQVSFDPWAATLGTYPVSVCTALPGDMDPSNDCQVQTVKVLDLNKTVYGYNAFSGSGTDPEGPASFNLATPGILNNIADQSLETFISGGTWANGTWYGTEYATAAPYNLITVDKNTGARTVIGDMGANMNALSFNTLTGVMYGIGYNSTSTASELYTINLETGAATLVGSTAGGMLLINLAINNAGQAYSVEMNSDNFGSVNLATGAFTAIGPVGFNASYAQDMEFDRDANELYMAAYHSSGELRWVDVATGSTMYVGAFEGGAEITGFAIPYNYISYAANPQIEQVSFSWDNYSAVNSIVGMFSGEFTLTSEAQYINVFTLDELANLYWIGQNLYLPDKSFTEEQLQKLSFTFDLTPLGIEEGVPLISAVPVCIMNTAEIITELPPMPPPGSFNLVNPNECVNNTGDGYPVLLPPGGIIEPWPFTPVIAAPVTTVIYRGCDVPNIDLDSANHPAGSKAGYAGDKNACGPAGASNSIEWLEKKHNKINNGQTHREALEDLSGEMGRPSGGGVSPEMFIRGKLKYTKKHKLPIHTKFQSKEHPIGDIYSADSTYPAKNMTGPTAKPDWNFFKSEMQAGEDVEVFIAYYNSSGTFRGGHVVTATGLIENAAGLQGFFYKDDRDQKKSDFTQTKQTFTWVNTTSNGDLVVPSESSKTLTAKITNFVSESYDSTIVWPTTKTLNLKLFLEGLYAGGGLMLQAMDEFGPHFGSGIADQVTVELRNDADFSSVEWSSGLVDLSTTGDVSVSTIPDTYSGSYWITLLHRNSILTVSANPISFTNETVTFDFTTSASQAYGDNQKNLGDGYFAFWGGDVNQDWLVDSGDMNPVDNLSTAVTFGYVPEDCNGDGIVDSGDMNIVDNNATAIIMAYTP